MNNDRPASTSEPKRSERMNYPEAASYVHLPVGTLYALVAELRIPHVRLGKRLVRFERAALEAWLEERRVHVAASGDLLKGGAK